jgi:predicted transposase/invertase (TIGR01784 family)
VGLFRAFRGSAEASVLDLKSEISYIKRMETLTLPKRLNPLNDYAFQQSMGKKGDEPQALSFLSSALERTGKGNIASVEIIEDTDIPAEIAGAKASKLDVLAKLADGTRTNIEVQIKNWYNMDRRTVFYWALKFTRDFAEGENYANLVPVIAINIIDFEYFKETEDFHTSFHIREDMNPDIILSEVLEIHFLEMPKFRRLLRKGGGFSMDDPLQRWLAFLDENTPKEIIEEALKMDTGIQSYQSRMDMIARSPEMLRAYEKYAKAASDWTSGINGAKREIAKSLKTDGMSVQQISKHTGLSEAEIQRL